MIGRLAACLVLAAVFTGVAPAAHARCPANARAAGWIEAPFNQFVAVGRAGARRSVLGGTGLVCTGDVVFADSTDVRLRLYGRTRVVPAPSRYDIPALIPFFLEQLRNDPTTFPLDQPLPLPPAVLGEEPPEFGVAGLRSGLARVSLGRAPLYLPVRYADGLTVTTVDPAGRRRRPHRISGDAALVELPAPDVLGKWTVEVSDGDTAIRGTFEVERQVAREGVPAPIAEAAAQLRPHETGRVLACWNVGRFGLEALRMGGMADRRQLADHLWVWSHPAADNICAASGD